MKKHAQGTLRPVNPEPRRTCAASTKFHFWEPVDESVAPHIRPPTPALPARVRAVLAFALLVICAGAAHAQSERASATISDISLGSGIFAYTISLTDTSAVNIETFWNAWVPGEDFMAVSPTNITEPSNWTANITGGGGSDGYAIQWVTSSNPLTPTHTFSFSFDSTVTPSAMDGDSVFDPGTPVETSFIYSGGPFSDAGFQFVVQPAAAVPEPSPGLLAGLGGLAMVGLGLSRRRLRCQAVRACARQV